MSLAAFHGEWPEALLSRIEDAGINASAPPQQLWLDGWLVRFSPGKAKRARCIQAVANGRLPLDERLNACQAVFRAAGLPMFTRVTPFTLPADLDQQLAARGHHLLDPTCVMASRQLPEHAPPTPPGLTWKRLRGDEYAEVVGALRGSDAAQWQAHALRLAHAPVPYQGWALQRREDSVTVACGQFAAEGELVGLYDVFTHPEHRGQGLAGLLCTALLAKAFSAGARIAYLQVDQANSSARAVYRRMGFADVYGYHYRSPEAGAH